MRNELARLDPDLGDFGVSRIHRLNSGRAHGAFYVACVVDHQLVAFAHAAQVLYCNGISDAIPDGGLFLLQVGKAVNGRFGFKKVVHRKAIISPPRHGTRKDFLKTQPLWPPGAKGKYLLFPFLVVETAKVRYKLSFVKSHGLIQARSCSRSTESACS